MTGSVAEAVRETDQRREVRISKATWRRRPQQVFLRRAIFQVHLWVGLLLALYAVVIGLSGSALVFRTEMERRSWTELYHVAPSSHRASLDAVIASVEADRPGWRVSSVEDFNQPARATTLLLRPAQGQLAKNYRMVSVQPYTGAVLADRMRFAGVLGWVSNLHLYLLAGKTGLMVSGWMAVGLGILCLTGLVVWWPGVHRWVSALYLRRHVRWRRFNWDLHAVVGFWLSLPLLLLTVTGLYFCFPKAIGKAVGVVTFSRPVEPPALGNIAGTTGPAMTVDAALETAGRLLPREAPAGFFALPMRKGGAYYATGYYKGAAPYSELVSLSFDGRTGKLLRYEDTRRASRGQRLVQHFFTWHFGSFGGDGVMGVVVKWVWVLIGLVPALLAVTGTTMFVVRKLL